MQTDFELVLARLYKTYWIDVDVSGTGRVAVPVLIFNTENNLPYIIKWAYDYSYLPTTSKLIYVDLRELPNLE